MTSASDPGPGFWPSSFVWGKDLTQKDAATEETLPYPYNGDFCEM
jgi:hypothetical protein